MIIYLNGELINDAPIFEFQDRLRLGDGVFDTMLILCEGVDLTLLRMTEHIKRLLNNAKLLDIKNLPKEKELYEEMREFISKSNLSEGRFALNTIITRGIAERGLMPQKNVKQTIKMLIAPAPSGFPPIHAIISETVRRNEGSPLSQIKSCNYGDNILALIEAQDKDSNEAIMLNNAGNVTCASAGNIFACIDGTLVTPPLSDGVMDGVTRKILMERMDVQKRSLTRAELENADGIYITNSIRGVSPVISLNGKTLPKPAIQIDKDFHLE